MIIDGFPALPVPSHPCCASALFGQILQIVAMQERQTACIVGIGQRQEHEAVFPPSCQCGAYRPHAIIGACSPLLTLAECRGGKRLFHDSIIAIGGEGEKVHER